ncbi:S8 family peptidase [Paenibacillus sp. GSMTC-2017]|uniref:S8 family peptidase n=1 Tax=Paenibacillus sp. GSMTC-2017 TaxID=2794350 RepID=UPI0018D88E1B|nr:S8 family peptidase [Paenibacillus sp. GSMTC-2017]MBH5319851.1 S8 family peptidase [Paenibacillus sp. GSMTC-2017]
MDTAALIRCLQQAMSNSTSTTTKRIVRFQYGSEYRSFLRKLSQEPNSSSLLKSIKPMPIISGFSCRLPSEVTLDTGRIWIEKDCEISFSPSSQRSPAIDNGIPWGIQQIKAPHAWSVTTGHRVKVGVIDTGVDFNHPDIRHSLLRGINLISRSKPPYDDNGHGTHIAGTIAAANQMQGMIGVAPRALIAPVKAFDHNGSAFVSDIVLGIEWCVRNGMDVINMSFGMKTRSKSLLGAVTSAYNSGIIIVASSGNDGRQRYVDYPARYPQTISVGATNRLRRIAPFSNKGAYIDIYAPGDKITSAWLRGNYNEMSGTSMATSHVSGAIALLLSLRPGLSPSEIKAIMKRSMQPLKSSKTRRSVGELDVLRMLQAAEKF